MIDKVIIFGHNGMLGSYISSYLKKYSNYKIININYRINNNFNDIHNILLDNNINNKTCIINCIGLIPQRNNSNISDYIRINSIFPNILYNICNIYKAKMIQPTTDCVFSGEKGLYTENDIPDSKEIYSISKILGENINCTVIRTSIIGYEISNKHSLLEWVISNNNNNINGWDNYKWNGITCLEYSKIVKKIIDNNLFWNGIKHIYSPNIVSKYELINLIIKNFNLNINLNKISIDNNIDRTLDSKYKKIFNIPTIEKQLKELYNYKI